MSKKQFKGGTKNESWKGSLSTGVLSNESHPTGDMSEDLRLLPRASLKRKNSKRETQRGLGKYGNIPPLTNVGRVKAHKGTSYGKHCPPYGGKVVRKCVKEGKCPSPGPRLLEIHNQHPSTSDRFNERSKRVNEKPLKEGNGTQQKME
ncbi:hypothetical protein TNCT_225701 [Trichonephila clavata]|uniref:Uncharacterized protein n=1 Tax=Trichonephila clavata TaxID=2740835 RepID=A0A8X6FE28_TRICU|nr:hypothetical protein TNCT_225701 [Trichonephila clavata]